MDGWGHSRARRSSGTSGRQSEKGQLRALTVGRQRTRLRGPRHTSPWLRSTWSTWSAVGNLTPRTGELRSAPSWPDDRYRVAGKKALALGGARSQGKGRKVNTGLRGLAPRTGCPLNCRTRPLLGANRHTVIREYSPRVSSALRASLSGGFFPSRFLGPP